jgi:uncharacterized cupin superfamily protein
MRIVKTGELEELAWSSPRGTFGGFGKQVSEALGREPESTDIMLRHPFDVEISRIPAGLTPFPYHSHGSQWEFYHVISGSGIVRHAEGRTPVVAGDAMLFKPGEAHTFTADAAADLVMFVVADNPMNESTYFPDSNKWVVKSPERVILRGERAVGGYFEGEEAPIGAEDASH